MNALQLALNYTSGTAATDLLADRAVRDVLGAPLSRLLRGVFDCMGIAEEEIADAKRQAEDAETRDLIEDAFRYLSPTDALRGKNSDLYRAHARELIVRVSSRQDLRPGTEAEALAVLCESSLIAPLNPVATLLYARLFRSVFPAATAFHFDAAYAGTDYYEHQADALLATTRRKLARERDVHAGEV